MQRNSHYVREEANSWSDDVKRFPTECGLHLLGHRRNHRRRRIIIGGGGAGEKTEFVRNDLQLIRLLPLTIIM